jgi:hypothetical protein
LLVLCIACSAAEVGRLSLGLILRRSSIISSGMVSGIILGAFGRSEVLLGDINFLFFWFLSLPLSPIFGLLAEGDSPGDFLLADAFPPPDCEKFLLGVRIGGR